MNFESQNFTKTLNQYVGLPKTVNEDTKSCPLIFSKWFTNTTTMLLYLPISIVTQLKVDQLVHCNC